MHPNQVFMRDGCQDAPCRHRPAIGCSELDFGAPAFRGGGARVTAATARTSCCGDAVLTHPVAVDISKSGGRQLKIG